MISIVKIESLLLFNPSQKVEKILMFKLIASFICVSIGSCSSSNNYYINPVVPGDHVDPGVSRLPDDLGFIAVTTTISPPDENGERSLFPIFFSKDLVNWSQKGYIFGQKNWPKWGLIQAFSPEIHYVDGKYNAYFTMRIPGANKKLVIGVAWSIEPFGPYYALNEPLISQPYANFHPTWFQDPKYV